MGHHLRYGQRFRVSSLICQRYEQQFGPFFFDVEVLALYRRKQVPLQPPDGDLHLKFVDELNEKSGLLQQACEFLAGGYGWHAPEYNWSPDLINGAGEWFLPALFRNQHLWLWLVGNDVVEFLG